MSPPLLDLHDLCVAFPGADGRWLPVVDRVSLRLQQGERIALVGESGCGKSMLALACLDLIPEPGKRSGGTIQAGGIELDSASPTQLEELRGRIIGLLLQEPMTVFNPVFSVGYQLYETLRVHRRCSRSQARETAASLARDVQLDDPQILLKAYPHQLSGGQLQRIALALALAGTPRLLIADEPTTALDVVTQAQVLTLITSLCLEHGMGLLLISHDLALVATSVERVVVMYAGELVEEAPAGMLSSTPLHPYTQLLLSSHSAQVTEVRRPLLGTRGCRFAPRCPDRLPACEETHPELAELPTGRRLRCPVALAEVHHAP